MRLLNAEKLQMEEFLGTDLPSYYILSHRWTDDEINFKDFSKGRRKNSKGYRKVADYCKYAVARHKVRSAGDIRGHFGGKWPTCYVWIDTVCIDKRSSAELSEAINSMYKYYEEAIECHAYLVDVRFDMNALWRAFYHVAHDHREEEFTTLFDEIESSPWFTRGWTLQELLAPKKVAFLNCQWDLIGWKRRCQDVDAQTKATGLCLNPQIRRITGIEEQYLEDPALIFEASIACRMHWASRRKLTRIEDEAYCLLGIFGINMPLLYGERTMAFQRLQEEIVSRSSDHTIFAWSLTGEEYKGSENLVYTTGVFARSPRDFSNSGDVTQRRNKEKLTYPFSVTNIGLQMQVSCRTVYVPSAAQYGTSQLFVLELDAHRKVDGDKHERVDMFLLQSYQNARDPEVNAVYRLHTNDAKEVWRRRGPLLDVRTYFIATAINTTNFGEQQKEIPKHILPRRLPIRSAR